MQRSIWVEDDEWDSVKEWAKGEDRTISRYLVHLHKDYVYFIENAENVRLKSPPRKVIGTVKADLLTPTVVEKGVDELVEGGEYGNKSYAVTTISESEVLGKMDLAAGVPKKLKDIELVPMVEEPDSVEPEDLKKKLESVTKKINHAIEVAGKKGVQANQDWRSDIKSRPKGQDGKKK